MTPETREAAEAIYARLMLSTREQRIQILACLIEGQASTGVGEHVSRFSASQYCKGCADHMACAVSGCQAECPSEPPLTVTLTNALNASERCSGCGYVGSNHVLPSGKCPASDPPVFHDSTRKGTQ